MTTPEQSTLSEQEFDALETKVKADCNEHVNGYCHTVACLKRGGWEKGCNPANFTPSCEAKQILRLIAQARAARPSPWLPIAEAPLDGTEILAFFPTLGVVEVRWWSGPLDDTHGGNRWASSWDGELVSRKTGCPAPTHFQPMPNPPSPPAQDGGTK